MSLQGRRLRIWGQVGCIVLLIAVFLAPAPRPALALNTDLAIGCTILGLLATPVIGYGIWRNLAQNRGHEGYFNGEFYAGVFWARPSIPVRI